MEKNINTAQKILLPLARYFNICLMLVVLLGGLMRYVNINYASLWGDELYSALLAFKNNSWYEILYMQREYQPPLYAFSLWIWVKIFSYNEFYIRLYTLLAGTACIWMSGQLGKKIHSKQVGLIMAVIVAFNPIQVWYSLEARFYVFIYLFAAISLWLYWHINFHKKQNWWLYILKAIVDATLCYFHHFGILYIFAQFLFDVYLLAKNKENKKAFYRNLIGYCLAGLLYLPWVIWGLSEAMKVKSYWLTSINILQYLGFSFQYPLAINIFCLLFITMFLFKNCNIKSYFLLLPFICIVATFIPVIYSYIKMPMLVPRYSMVIAPVMYAMLAIGMWHAFQFLQKFKTAWIKPAVILIILAFIIPGFYMSFINKSALEKQPWREMANWLNRQPDIDSVKVYSIGAYVKKSKDIDFYMHMPHSSYQVSDIVPGKETKMYLIESNGVWQIKDSVLHRLDSFYVIKKQSFNPGTENFGNIYVCEKNNNR